MTAPAGKLIGYDDAFNDEVTEPARSLLLGLSQYPSVARRGIGDALDALSVKEARDAIISIESELRRIDALTSALNILRAEITGSVQ
jgi:hypothetical protein